MNLLLIFTGSPPTCNGNDYFASVIITEIESAINLLESGQLVAIPTETVYGLAANGFNGDAIAKIYEVKNRPRFNPLILHSNARERFENWGIQFPETAKVLANAFWPGPLTLVLPKSKQIPDLVTAGGPNVAIRVPNHELSLKLLLRLPFPLAAPSANLSGTVSPTTAQHVEAQLGKKIAAVLDGGPCNVGLESTIISLAGETPKLLRLGGLSVESIEQVMGGKLNTEPFINNENPEAPGMLSRHYAPQTPLRIGIADEYSHLHSFDTMAFIAFSKGDQRIPLSQQFVLSPEGNLNEAAQRLFAAIRQADQCGAKIIIAEKFPDEHLGRAINDRLKRASQL